jgi:hypothetical protein
MQRPTLTQNMKEEQYIVVHWTKETMPLGEHNHKGNNNNNGEGTLDKAPDGTKWPWPWKK